MKLTISELDRELRTKNLRPVYFIFGPESYLVNTALSRIKKCAATIAGDGFEPDRFEGRQARAADIVTCAKTLPMWTSHRLIIVSEAAQLKEPDSLESYLKKPSTTATVVLVSDSADGRTKLVQLLNSYTAVIECRELYDDRIPDWIRMEAESKGKTISMGAAEVMAELVGSSLGELASALDKIILYIGEKKMIGPDDVETVLTETGRRDVFEFAESVGKRNLPRALHILKRLSDFGENEVMLLSMLARHWRILIKARQALAAKNVDRGTLPRLLGIKPFFLDGYLSQARLFTGKELKNGFNRLYITDKKLKSSRLPKRDILQRCVMGLLTGN